MTDYHYLFVYGTLRPPQAGTPAEDARYFPAIAPHIHSHTPATLADAELYDLGAYPAATPGAGVIYGDLLQVAADALPIADRIEGHPTFYCRAETRVQTGQGEVAAWIYWAPPGLTIGRRQITNGDWFQRHLTPTTVAEPTPPDATTIDPVVRTLITRFADEPCSWLSTVRPDGRAHSAPVWHVWYQGRAYVITRSQSVKAANIEENPSVVLTHPDPANALIMEGWATAANHMRPILQPLFLAKYNWDIGTDAAYDRVIEMTPTKLLAWGNYGEGKWAGGDVLKVW
ncbi:MAG: gamma-glutamylcyclotransferase [Caldilineaceae bacterium]